MGAQQHQDILRNHYPDFFSLSARAIGGEVIQFSQFRDVKLLLIVNIACKAPRASAHFSDLVHLYQSYEKKGLQILAFPSNAFGNELATDQEIGDYIQANFKARFLIFERTEVNGSTPHPVYVFLRSKGPLYSKSRQRCRPIPSDFTYFLVNGQSEVIAMINSSTRAECVDTYLKKILQR